MLEIQQSLREFAKPEKTISSARFFKTGAWEYGEWDVFLGITVPEVRLIAKNFAKKVDFKTLEILLESEAHEDRLLALHILVIWAKNNLKNFSKNPENTKENIKEFAEFYLAHTNRINNWDLVDASAEWIIGPYLEILDDKNLKNFKEKMIQSNSLWENRIIVVSSLYSIRKWESNLILELAEKFLYHPHDLMQKATGWMLREMGKRSDTNTKILENFLQKNAATMPRTMLRYSLEKFSPEKREYYMKLKNSI